MTLTSGEPVIIINSDGQLTTAATEGHAKFKQILRPPRADLPEGTPEWATLLNDCEVKLL